jgi:hypothetical protein
LRHRVAGGYDVTMTIINEDGVVASRISARHRAAAKGSRLQPGTKWDIVQ